MASGLEHLGLGANAAQALAGRLGAPTHVGRVGGVHRNAGDVNQLLQPVFELRSAGSYTLGEGLTIEHR